MDGDVDAMRLTPKAMELYGNYIFEIWRAESIKTELHLMLVLCWKLERKQRCSWCNGQISAHFTTTSRRDERLTGTFLLSGVVWRPHLQKFWGQRFQSGEIRWRRCKDL